MENPTPLHPYTPTPLHPYTQAETPFRDNDHLNLSAPITEESGILEHTKTYQERFRVQSMKLGILAITTVILNLGIVMPVASVKSQELSLQKADMVQAFVNHANHVTGNHP